MFQVSLNPTGECQSVVKVTAARMTMNHPTGKVRFRSMDGTIVAEFDTQDVDCITPIA